MKGFLVVKNESLFGDTSTQLPHILKCYVLNYFLSNNHQTITRKSIQFAHFALLNGIGSPKPLLTTLIFPWMALVWVVDMGHKKRTMPGVWMLALQWYGNVIYVILSKCLTFGPRSCTGIGWPITETPDCPALQSQIIFQSLLSNDQKLARWGKGFSNLPRDPTFVLFLLGKGHCW